jgi:NAD+ kinase
VSGTATVFTHARPQDTRDALALLIDVARRAGYVLRFDPEETRKHGLSAGEGIEVDADVRPDLDMCICLGGDGTILRGLRAYAGTGVPVFAVNFGQIGFLATVDPEDAEHGFERAFARDFDVLELPAIAVAGRDDGTAINDISLHRRPDGRVAQLAYAVGDDEIGRVRCDGLVVSTAAGSTGYNLANGGPVLAWGVEGYVVSFIAPHSLTARALVVAPTDRLILRNVGREDAVDVHIDGAPTCDLEAGDAIEIAFVPKQGQLAQIPGTNFYHRLREKFGRLAS